MKIELDLTPEEAAALHHVVDIAGDSVAGAPARWGLESRSKQAMSAILKLWNALNQAV